MKPLYIVLLAALMGGCAPPPPVDLSGKYLFDPDCIVYPKVGGCYFPFIDYDTVPFSVICVQQIGRDALVLRYEANEGTGVVEKVTRYDLRDKRFSFGEDRLLFRHRIDHKDFAVVWGKRTTIIRIHRDADGSLVFENRLTIKSVAIPMGFPIWNSTTHTGIVVLAVQTTNTLDGAGLDCE